MKVTALLPDDLVREVQKLTGRKSIWDSILVALQDYVARQKIKKAVQKVNVEPLRFADGVNADLLRSTIGSGNVILIDNSAIVAKLFKEYICLFSAL